MNTNIEDTIPPWERLSSLRGCISQKGYARLMEAHSGLSGIIVQSVRVQVEGEVIEYDGLWESSLTDSATKGLPDASIVGTESRTHTIDEILNVTTKPILVDGDTGGEPAQFEYLVRKLERMGVSGVIIEDKRYPKRNSLDHSASQELEDPEVFAQRIQVGRDVTVTDDFMVIARLESLIAGTGLEDALERAERYVMAGADGIMIHSRRRNPSEILAFAEAYQPLCRRLGRRPLLASVPTTYNTITDSELASSGFNIIIHANHLLRAAYKAMNKAAISILENGRSLEAEPICAPVSEVFSSVGLDRITTRDRERAEALRSSYSRRDGGAAPQSHAFRGRR